MRVRPWGMSAAVAARVWQEGASRAQQSVPQTIPTSCAPARPPPSTQGPGAGRRPCAGGTGRAWRGPRRWRPSPRGRANGRPRQPQASRLAAFHIASRSGMAPNHRSKASAPCSTSIDAGHPPPAIHARGKRAPRAYRRAGTRGRGRIRDRRKMSAGSSGSASPSSPTGMALTTSVPPRAASRSVAGRRLRGTRKARRQRVGRARWREQAKTTARASSHRSTAAGTAAAEPCTNNRERRRAGRGAAGRSAAGARRSKPPTSVLSPANAPASSVRESVHGADARRDWTQRRTERGERLLVRHRHIARPIRFAKERCLRVVGKLRR